MKNQPKFEGKDHPGHKIKKENVHIVQKVLCYQPHTCIIEGLGTLEMYLLLLVAIVPLRSNDT